MEVQVQAAEILKRPYARVLTPDPDGRVTAEIMEFPGCVAYGDNTAQALACLEEVASEWIDAALEQGQDIPEPMSNVDYSGRLNVRMPPGLHKRAAIYADREGISLNMFIVTCIAESVGERARPQFVYALPVQASARFNFQVLAGGSTAMTVTNSGFEQLSTDKQLSTSETPGVIGMPMPLRRERAHARG